MTRLVPAPPGLFPAPSRPRSKRAAASAKGARLEKLARALYEAEGCRVESAPKVVRWVKLPDEAELKPRSARHDFFGVWDLIAVDPAGRVVFVQVTVVAEVAHRRRKILTSGFPAGAPAVILAYAGRGLFRVFLGPTFTEEAPPRRAPVQRKARRAGLS